MNKFVLDKKGVGELLKSEEIQSVLDAYGQQVQTNTGSAKDYQTQVSVGKVRANVVIRCINSNSVKDNLKNNTLLKALGGTK